MSRGKRVPFACPQTPEAPLSLPAREELRTLFQSRAKLSPVCRAVAGLEGTSQQAQQRSCAVRRMFASSLAAVKRKAPCSQIKLQMVSGALFSWGGSPPTRPQGELSRRTSSELSSRPEGTGSQPPTLHRGRS